MMGSVEYPEPMNTPTLHFLGWNRPAIELVAEKMEALQAAAPDAFRRATVVVPTSESGRRLREYMAERAGKPILMPKIILAGQLIPCEGTAVATETDTLAAWLQVLGSSVVMQGKSAAWMLDVACQMQRVRKQLEQENRSPMWEEDVARDFIRFHLEEDPAAWQHTLSYERERWAHLRTMFAAVDDALQARGLCSAEQIRAREMERPGRRGLIIIACVPELSPQNRLYLKRLTETQAGKVQIWVNAPESERERFDVFGQPIPTITQGAAAGQGWCECAVQIPRVSAESSLSAQGVIHSVAGAAEFGRMARKLAGGCDSRQVVIASCDSSFSASLVTAFQPEWELMLPEGRSFLSTEVGQIPRLLLAACTEADATALYDEASGEVQGGSSRRADGFLALLRNCPLQRSLAPRLSLGMFNAWLDELVNQHLPGSAQHVLAVAEREAVRPGESDYVAWIARLRHLVDSSGRRDAFPSQLCGLASGLLRQYGNAEPKLQGAVRRMAELMQQVSALVEQGACEPLPALALLEYTVGASASGVLEGAHRRDAAINVRGWRELSFARERRVILTGMHEGCVPERAPADSWLPDAYRSFLKMTDGECRRARDTFLLTALLQSRPAGEVHMVLARSSADGTPVAPSSLLLRCATLSETAQRVSRLYADPPAPTSERAYTPTPLLSLGEVPLPEPGRMESICLLGEGLRNPYAEPGKTWSPSRVKSFLACPLRFWLDCLLKVNPGDELEPEKAEPDAAEYGDLLHAVLQETATEFASASPGIQQAELQGQIEAFAASCAERVVQGRYGDEDRALAAPLQLMLNNLKRSLHAWSALHAADLCAGWEVQMCERQLEFTLPAGEGEEPIPFSMRVDRVDCHRVSRKYRVIDYKTNDSPPDKTHLEGISGATAALYETWMPPELYLKDDSGKMKRWVSVQLPLYAEAIRQLYQLEELPETAFYNLPRTRPSEVKYHAMKENELHEAAMDCVRRVAALMRAGECLLSAESLGRSLRYGQFGALGIHRNSDPRRMCSLPALPAVDNNQLPEES